VLHWTELTPDSSTFIVSKTLLPPKASNIVHEHSVDCVSPLFLQSTACPLPFLGCFHAPTFLRRLCVDYLALCWHSVNCLSSRRLHVNYSRKPQAPPKPRVPCYLEQHVCHHSSYRLLHLLPSVCWLLVRVDYSFVLTTRSCWLLVRVDYSFVLTTRSCWLLVRVDYLSSRRLLLISTCFGNTVCCSKYLQWVGYGPRILGRCQPTHSYAIQNSGPQETSGGNFGHASPKSTLLMARNRKLYREPYIMYLWPCNLDNNSDLRPSGCVQGFWLGEFAKNMCLG